MGVGWKCSSGNYMSPNPDPYNFKVIQVIEGAGGSLAYLRYPDCDIKGRYKLILFRSLSEKQIRELKSIDPHISRNKDIIARLKDDPESWDLAVKLLEVI